MFTNRAEDRSISYSFFGAADAMPIGLGIKIGDTVTLMQSTVSVDVRVTLASPTATYRGVVIAIESENESLPSLATTLKVDMPVEFTQQQIHRCTRESI